MCDNRLDLPVNGTTGRARLKLTECVAVQGFVSGCDPSVFFFFQRSRQLGSEGDLAGSGRHRQANMMAVSSAAAVGGSLLPILMDKRLHATDRLVRWGICKRYAVLRMLSLYGGYTLHETWARGHLL